MRGRTCRHGAGCGLGSGEECMPTEWTPHPFRVGGGHRMPAGLLPPLQAPLCPGQFLTKRPLCKHLAVTQASSGILFSSRVFYPGTVQVVKTCIRRIVKMSLRIRENHRWL